MPRTKRIQISGATQLLYQRGHNGAVAFTRESDYQTYLESLHDSATNAYCRVHAYALLPTGIYVLCTPTRADGVSRMMKAVGAKYGYHFNRHADRTGSLWDGRYRSCVVESGRFLLACYLFVDSRQSEDFGQTSNPWSSHASHASGKNDLVVDDHWVYQKLSSTASGRQHAYRQLMELGLSPTLDAELRVALQHNLVLGSDSFKDEISRLGHARVRMGKPGRPRKTPIPPVTIGSAANPARALESAVL